MNLMDTDRKGFCALRVHLSSHEWTWTQAEQEEMANELLRLDTENEALRAEVERLVKSLEKADTLLDILEELGAERKLPAHIIGGYGVTRAAIKAVLRREEVSTG